MGAVQMLKTRFAKQPNLLEKRLSDSRFPEDVDSYEPSYEYQGQEHDRLYNARYQHVEDGQGKDWCGFHRGYFLAREDNWKGV